MRILSHVIVGAVLHKWCVSVGSVVHGLSCLLNVRCVIVGGALLWVVRYCVCVCVCCDGCVRVFV